MHRAEVAVDGRHKRVGISKLAGIKENDAKEWGKMMQGGTVMSLIFHKKSIGIPFKTNTICKIGFYKKIASGEFFTMNKNIPAKNPKIDCKKNNKICSFFAKSKNEKKTRKNPFAPPAQTARIA